jgi:hypothetical protein
MYLQKSEVVGTRNYDVDSAGSPVNADLDTQRGYDPASHSTALGKVPLGLEAGSGNAVGFQRENAAIFQVPLFAALCCQILS